MPKPAFLFLIRDAGWERIKADMVARPTRTLEGRTFPAATPQRVQRALTRSLSLEASAPHRMTATAQASGA
jgi:hypothetical protein